MGEQRERGDDVSQPPVGPLLSSLAYRWSHSAAAASAHSCVNPSAMQPSTRRADGRRGGWRGHLNAGHVGAGMDKGEEQGGRVGAAAPL